MSKKSKKQRKGQHEPADKQAAVETPQPSAGSKPTESKLKRYKDIVCPSGTELYQALEDKDMEKAKKLYDELDKQWKADYGDFDPAKINQQIRERFQLPDRTKEVL